MTLVWRHAVERELDAVVALIREDARSPVDRQANTERLERAFRALAPRRDAHLIVGVRDEEVIATYQLFLIEAVSLSAPLRAQVEDVRVGSAYRGQGIGAALMADAERRASDYGATLIQLLSSKGRDEAHTFYERRGYRASHFGCMKTL